MANTVSRYRPQDGMSRLPDVMDRLLRESFVMPSLLDRSIGGNGRPTLPVNLFETPDGYVLDAALPGLDPEKIDLQVVGREVTIKGQFETKTPENANWVWQGIPAGEFFETYTLPVDVQGDSTEASYEQGILSLKLPKAEHLRPRSIKVNVTK